VRRFWIGLVSLGVLFAIYLFYKHMGGSGEIDFSPPPQFVPGQADSNLAPSDGPIGKSGDFEVAKYIHCNDNNQIDRVFGFKKLLHKVGDELEMDGPYVDIIDANFVCKITADTGQLRVEKTGGGLTPTEGNLLGNVVLHILPRNESRVKEAFLYLDDIAFVSERSHFSTAGPVRFVSADARMVGTGLEGAYNAQQSYLEYIRITDLQSLRIKSSQAGLLATEEAPAPEPRTAAAAPAKPIAGASTTIAVKQPSAAAESDRSAAPEPPARHYKCILAGNVTIDAPEQLVIAEDEIAVMNILWKSSSAPSSQSRVRPSDTNAAPLAPAQSATVAPGSESAVAPPAPQAAPAEANEHPLPPDEDYDIVITCENGILALPMDSSRSLKDFAPAAGRPAGRDLPDRAGRNLLVARKIEHDAGTRATIAAGPVELVFDVNDPTGRDANAPATPVKVTAKKAASFVPAANQVVFEGGCRATMIERDANGVQQHTLAAPTITVDFAKGGGGSSADFAGDIEHLTAGPEDVSLSSVTDAEGPQRGGVELKCRRFEYETAGRMFMATGPGEIKVDNSKAVEPNKPSGKFSFRRRCYALVRDFQTLHYYLDANRLVADAGADALLDIGYVPVIDANYGQAVKAGAGHIEALFNETADGGLEISTLSATGGITYDDGDKDFEGDRLFYDAEKPLVTVLGTPGRACLFKGTAVDAIQWDPNTNHLSFEIPAPGTLPLE